MDFIKKLIAENPDVSCMRFMSLVALLIGGGIAFIGMFQGKDPSQLSTLVGVFVGAAFGGKVAQKFAEVKSAGDSK